MKLYYSPQTRASRPRWLLEELEVPYELVRLNLQLGEHKSEQYMAIHPHGAVPALTDGHLVMIESAAICMYLADKFPEKGLAPTLGSAERGHYYQWMVYAMATLEPPVHQYATHTSFLPEGERIPAVAEAAKQKFLDACRVIDGALGEGQFLVGGRFSAVDVIVSSILVWSKFLGLLETQPKLGAYVKAMTRRPAYKRARAD